MHSYTQVMAHVLCDGGGSLHLALGSSDVTDDEEGAYPPRHVVLNNRSSQ